MKYWNNERPNGAIGYLFPVEVFYKDRKSAINSGYHTAIKKEIDLSPNSYAVILLDVSDIIFSDSVNAEIEKNNMKQVLMKANELGIPVIATKYGEDNEILDELIALKADDWIFIEKDHYSAFEETNLNNELCRLYVNSLIIIGFNQKACILETARDANKKGYNTYSSFDIMQGTIRMKSEEGNIVTDQDEIERYENDRLKPVEIGTTYYYKNYKKEKGVLYKIDDVNQETEYPKWGKRGDLRTLEGLLIEFEKINFNILDKYTDLPIFTDKKETESNSEANNQEKFAVLLIDVFNSLRYDTVYDEFDNMGAVLKKANSLGIPVFEAIMTNSATSGSLLKYKNNNWYEIRKEHASAFDNTELNDVLSSMGITSLILSFSAIN